MSDIDALPHGKRRYRAGCTCRTCRRAVADYARHRGKQVAYGRWRPFVDAEPIREHLRALQASGMGWMRAAHMAGVAPAVVSHLLYGAATLGGAPSVKIRTYNADRLLAVKVTMDTLAGAALIDATGTRRRLQALVALGWTQRAIATRLGCEGTKVTVLTRASTVMVSTARKVRDLFTVMAFQAPPSATKQDRYRIQRAKTIATKYEWVTAMAWTNIDDPTEMPAVDAPEDTDPDEVVVGRLVAGVETTSRMVDRLEAARRLYEAGDLVRELHARRLHMGMPKLRELTAQWDEEVKERVAA